MAKGVNEKENQSIYLYMYKSSYARTFSSQRCKCAPIDSSRQRPSEQPFQCAAMLGLYPLCIHADIQPCTYNLTLSSNTSVDVDHTLSSNTSVDVVKVHVRLTFGVWTFFAVFGNNLCGTSVGVAGEDIGTC